MTVLTATCPNDGTFEAEVETRVSRSSHEVATVDAPGQHPTMADQLASTGAPLTRAQWDLLASITNPSWVPTYARVVLDDPVEHRVAVCPSCGSPIKVG